MSSDSVAAIDGAEATKKDPLFEFLRQELTLKRQTELMEMELQRRLEIVREHHSLYTRIANYFVKVLTEGAELSLQAVKSLSEPRGSHSPAKASLHRDPNGMTAGASPTTLVDSPSYAAQPQSVSPHRAQSSRERSARGRNSWISEEDRPNRLVVVPPSAAAARIASTLTLTARPQIHSKIVAERRMGKEIITERQRLAEFAEREQRRVAAFARKNAIQMQKTAHDETKVRHVKDRRKVQLDEERRMRYLREALREKHDRISDRTKLLELERQAAASAIRRLDHTTRKALEDSKRALAEEMHRSAGVALAVQEHSDWQRMQTVKTTNSLKCNRLIAQEEFNSKFEKEINEQRKGLYRDEHHAAADYRRATAAAPAVEVTWPSGILQPMPRPETRPIQTDEYARLCGVREGILQEEDLQRPLAEIETLKHLAPQHWALLKAATPNPEWEALQRVQAAVVRGPIYTEWRR